MLLLSMRRLSNLVAFSAQYEFEDVIAQATGADRVDVDGEAALEFSRRVYKMLRAATRSPSLAQRMAPLPPTVALQRDYRLFLPIFNHTHELYALTTIRDWRARCKFAACFITEVWTHLLPEYLLELLGQFDHVFVGMRHCVADVARITGKPCSYLPQGADVLRFSPWPAPPARCIDVCNIGRRSAVSHEALIALAKARRFFYYFDTFASGAGKDRKQRTFRVTNAEQHRLLLASLLQRSRYYIANRSRINEPEHTGQHEEISGRFYEGAAAGTVMLGEPPRTEEFRAQFGWPDAVIRVPFDCPDFADVLAELDRDPARLERICRGNARHAALRHDWLHRLEVIFETAGIERTPGMLERERRLSELAVSIGETDRVPEDHTR